MRRLWYHGKVDTMVPGKDRQQAIGVEDGTIVFVGSDRDPWHSPGTRKPTWRAARGSPVSTTPTCTCCSTLCFRTACLWQGSLPSKR